MSDEFADFHQNLSSLSKDELVSLITSIAESDDDVCEKIKIILKNKFLRLQNQNDCDLKLKTPSGLQTENSVSPSPESSAQEKINLYKSLFRGRTDVYALRWKNAKSGKSGYSPVCKNKWVQGKCNIKTRPCAMCPFNEPVALDDIAILKHFRGDDSLCRDVIGLYPLMPDNTCFFLALDFDEKDWQEYASAIRQVCLKNAIPACFEISRSGNGVHIWFFFEEAVSAKNARLFGEIILNLAMNQRHELPFSSFGRMFPNQDEMPKGSYGNLIALPLQGRAVREGKSVFVDENFVPYSDQWAYLSSVKKLSAQDLNSFIKKVWRYCEDRKFSFRENKCHGSRKTSRIVVRKI